MQHLNADNAQSKWRRMAGVRFSEEQLRLLGPHTLRRTSEARNVYGGRDEERW